MNKFIAVFFAVFVSLALLVVFAFLFFGVFSYLGADIKDAEALESISIMFTSSFAVVIALITLLLNLAYTRNRSLFDRNSSVKPLVTLSKSLPDDKFYSDSRFRVTVNRHCEGKYKDYNNFKCVLHNYGLGIAQKLVFIVGVGGKFYKAEGSAQVLKKDSEISVAFSYFICKGVEFDLFSGFQDVYGNLFFMQHVKCFDENDLIYGDKEESVSVENNIMIDSRFDARLFNKLRKAYFSESTKMIE